MIRNFEEKKGGIQWMEVVPLLFQYLIEELKIVDVNIINGLYTWNNRHGD